MILNIVTITSASLSNSIHTKERGYQHVQVVLSMLNEKFHMKNKSFFFSTGPSLGRADQADKPKYLDDLVILFPKVLVELIKTEISFTFLQEQHKFNINSYQKSPT